MFEYRQEETSHVQILQKKCIIISSIIIIVLIYSLKCVLQDFNISFWCKIY